MKSPILLFVSCMFFMASVYADPPAGTDEGKTREVVNHHWQTFQGNDLDGVMADYTEDSVLITPRRTYKGLKEIRDSFVKAYTTYPASTTAMKLNKVVINRDVGYILWEASGPKVKLLFGTDTFIVKDGKIIDQTFGGVDGTP